MARLRSRWRLGWSAAVVGILFTLGCGDSTAPSTPTHLTFVVEPNSMGVGSAIAPAVVVAVRDEDNRTVRSWTNTVRLSLESGGGSATLLGTTNTASVSGTAVFDDLLIDGAGAGYRLVATSGALAEGVSQPFTVHDVFVSSSVAAGYRHTCALSTDGTAFCWGGNSSGQLGDGTLDDRSVPTPVSTALRFTTITVGWSHSCGLTSDGVAHCWGRNSSGQLGDGTDRRTPTPTEVEGGHRFTAISAAWSHTCGLTADGSAYCWGDNNYGQLGDGTTQSSLNPTTVAGGHHFTAIDAGYLFTCGITNDGSAHCWGDNHYGMLGDGTQEDQADPTPVAGELRFASLSAGNMHTCGVATNGTAHCWGRASTGQLGAPTTETCGSASHPCSTIPLEVSGNIAFDQIAAGGAHTCAIARDGTAYCWGWDGSGQLGTASIETCGDPQAAPMACSSTPVQVSGSTDFDHIAAGVAHTCAVARDGTTSCWGDNQYGQLGDGSTEDHASPTALTGSVRFATVSAGSDHTCGVVHEGILYCWGSNGFGQLGDDSGSLGWPMPIAVWGW